MHIPVQSPWMPGYIDVTQTALVMLIMAGLCLDRPRITTLNFPEFLRKLFSYVGTLDLLIKFNGVRHIIFQI